MKKMAAILLTVFALSLMFSCNNTASAAKKDNPPQVNKKQPSWITIEKKDKDNYYFTGYTEDSDALENVKTKALQNAKGKIANNIFEETSVEKIFTTSGGLSDNADLQKNYQENIKSQSAVNLMGVETEDTYYETENDSGIQIFKVWVLAKISKSNLEKERNRIISEIQRKLALVDNNLKQADAFLADGKALDAVNSYVSAAISSTKVKERIDEFPIYINKAGKVLASIVIDSGDNPKVVDTGRGSNFTFTVTYASDKGNIPVSGAAVSFVVRNNNGEYTKTAVTGDNGTAVCSIRNLKEVRADNALYAKVGSDFQEILDLGNDYKKYYSTLKDYADKTSTFSEFRTVSSENRNIQTTVIAMVNDNGKLKQLPNLASEAQSYLLNKGYKVVRFSDSIPLDDVYDAKQSALSILADKGIKRVFVLSVSSDSAPKYNKDVDRYIGIYSISAQLLDTSTGEVISANNIKVSATSQDENSVFDAFIKAAGAQIKKLIN
jgi:hypothetical protein